MDFAALVASFSRMAESKGLVNSLEGNLSMIDRTTAIFTLRLPTKRKACSHRI